METAPNRKCHSDDSLGYFERLKAAGVLEEQARVQADAMRQQTEEQRHALQTALDKDDEASRKELATKGDLQDVRLEIQDVRNELKAEIADTKHEILKWVPGIALAQTAVIVAVIGVAIAVLMK